MSSRFLCVVLLSIAAVAQAAELPDFRAPKPDLPDLIVTYIERNPKYPGTHVDWLEVDEGPDGNKGNPADSRIANPFDQKWPRPGERVTFTAHVKNKGPIPAPQFDWHWLIDGKEVASGLTPGLEPNSEATYEYEWTWQHGDHWVSFELDRWWLIEEISKKNNFVADKINALGFHFFVQQDVYDWFDTIQSAMGSYCWEDWAQFQIREMNRMFRDDIFPAAPDGIKERVRIDKITILPNDYEDPGGTHAPINNVTGGCDGVWGFTNGLLTKDENGKSFYERKPEWLFGPEWPLMHELGHQLGQPDYYLLPVRGDRNNAAPGIGYNPPERVHRIMMFSGNWAHDAALGQDKVKWDSTYRFWGEHSAASFNRDLGVRRGFFANFLVDIPKSQRFRVVDENAQPVANANVELFRTFSREYGNGSVSKAPAFTGRTDDNGIWVLEGSPYGFISNWTANGSLFFRVTSDGQERYGWLDIRHFNLEYWRGHTDMGQYTLQVKPRHEE